MASVADTAEGSGELDINTWLINNKLSSLLKNEKFLESIKEQELSVNDMIDLTEDELIDFVQECELRVLEKKKFINAVQKLQFDKPKEKELQKPMRITIIMSEAEENAIENVKNEEKKYEKYIFNINEWIKNTKENAKNSENIIDKEFNKMIETLNKRKTFLKKQLKNIENKKLKIYNDNLNKAQIINKQLKNIQIEWNKLFENININKNDRKNKITLQSQNILKKSKNIFKNDMIHSVNHTFNVQFNYTQNLNYIGNIGKIDGNEAVPELSVIDIDGNNVDIKVELKGDDNNICLYQLQCKEIKDDEYDEYDDDDEKKQHFCGYLEFKNSKYTIKNLKFECKYSIRAKVKINKIWSNYSNIKSFKTQKKLSWILDSKILTDPNEIGIFENLLAQKLKSILNKNVISLKLIYRNSRDGNSANAFHSKCNAYSNTIILVQSNYNHIFGGFATYKWGSSSRWNKDDNAFLFLIKSAFKHQPTIYKNVKKDNYAIYDHSAYGPTFGNGHDLVLQECGNNSTHYSELGETYEGRGNVLCGGPTHKSDKTSHHFDLKEYEVFSVN